VRRSVADRKRHGTADFDVIVIGSGPSGVQAAQAAVTRGAKVGLVDVGHVDDTYRDAVPDRPFAEIRRSDASQRRFFLGEQLEGARSDTHRIGVGLFLAANLAVLMDQTGQLRVVAGPAEAPIDGSEAVAPPDVSRPSAPEPG